jgi:predicted dehydrogenase
MGATEAPLGVAFVGAGMVAELHYRACQAGGHLGLIGIVEPRDDLAVARTSAWDCIRFPDIDAALADPRVDALLVLSPAETHARAAHAAIAAAKPVLVEKPVASIAELEDLHSAAETAGTVCMPGHNYAYQPEFAQLRRLVASGDLGSIRAAWITYLIRHAEEVARHYSGVLSEVMIHHTYLGLALFGVPARVHAGRSEPAWAGHTAEDQAWMTWEYPAGVTLSCFASFAVDDDTSQPWTFVVKALGDQGGAAYNWRDAIFRRPLGSLPFAVPAYENSYIHEQAAFAAASRGDQSAIVSPLGDALAAARILGAAEQAATQHASVDIAATHSPARRGAA